MKREVARGALWMLAEMGSWEGLAFVVFLIMARLLTPADYGIASIAGAITFFAQVAIMRGLADAVVALGDLDEDAISAAFWATLLIGMVLFATLEAAAGGIALAFGQPLLAPVLRWCLICVITASLVSIPLAVLRRRLRFAAFALRSAGGGVVGGLVGVAMAFSGYGVWAIVGNHVAQGIAAVALVWSTSDWRPRLRFSARALRRLARFSVQAALGAELDAVASKIDLMIVGLSFNAASVGHYYLVKRILQAASGATVYPVWSVCLPALGRLAVDRARFNKAYVLFIGVAQAFWLPVVLGFGVMAPDLVPMLFGPHWQAAVPVAQAACLLSLTYAVVLCTGQALCAAERADLYAWMGFLQILIMGVLFAAASRLDVVAAAYALSASFAVMLPLQLSVLRRATGLAYHDFVSPYLRMVAAGAAMTAAVLATRTAAASIPGFWRIPLEVMVGAGAYAGSLWLFAQPICLELLAVARDTFARRGSASMGAPGSRGTDG